METRKGVQRGAGFQLAGFPKEFERNIWEELDKRFWSILLFTWVVSFGLAFYLSNKEWHISEEEIARLKEKVIRTVYSDIIITEEPAVEDTGVEGPGVAEEEKPEEKEISEEGKKIVEESVAERVQRRRRARQSRAQRTRQMEQAVASTGILAVATAAGGGGGGDVGFSDVLKDVGGGGVADIGEVVAGTSGLVAATSSKERTRVAKGGGYRGAGEGVGIDDLIEGEGVSRSASFRRRGEIKLAASDLGLSGAATGAASRDPESLMLVINQNKGSVEYCIQKSLKVNPSLKGRIDLELEIDPTGKVVKVRVLKSTIPDKKLERCILRTVKRWRGFGKIDPTYGNLRLRLPFII